MVITSNYSPFGVTLSGRNFTLTGADKSRYGYQGSEKDDEMKGEGNSYATFNRMLDPRLGRWFSLDPVVQPWQSPYCSMDNNPIRLNDPLGNLTDKEAKEKHKQHKKELKKLDKRLKELKHNSKELSKQEKKQAYNYAKKNNGIVESWKDINGINRYSVKTKTDYGESIMPQIPSGQIEEFFVERQVFYKDEWKLLREERANIKKDFKAVEEKIAYTMIEHYRSQPGVIDAMTFTAGGTFVPGAGNSVQVQVAYFFWGPDKGFHTFLVVGSKKGFDMSAGASIGVSHFNGNSKDMTVESYLGKGYEGNGGVGFISGGGSCSYRNNGDVNWIGGSGGVSISPFLLGGNGGETETIQPKIYTGAY